MGRSAPNVFPPPVEVSSRNNLSRDTAVVEGNCQLRVEGIDASKSLTKRVQVLYEVPVALYEGMWRGPFTCDEGVANEHLTCRSDIYPLVTDTSASDHWQPKQRRPLNRDGSPTLGIPRGLAIATFHQVTTEPFCPFGLHARANASP